MTDRRTIMRTLIASNLALMFGFQIWRTVFNNYAVENLGLGAGAVGVIQAVREIPGLLGFLFVMIVNLLGSELRVMGVNIILLGVGLILTSMAQGFAFLVVATLVGSIGFHYFYSGSQSVLLQITPRSDTPQSLGRLSSAGSFGSILATVVVLGLALVLDNNTILLLGGLLVIAVGIALFPRMNTPRRYEHHKEPARDSIRRSYWLYYSLTFLMGTRRHIFTTFAIFMLVQVHGLETWQTAALFLVNSVVSFVALPQLGKLVAVFGEKKVLSFNFVCLTGIFLGYATIEATAALVALFVLDNLFFGFNLAINSYFQKIAVMEQDITPNMSLGQSINHIAAVTIPIVGGWMWVTFHPSTPFVFGAIIALVSLALTYWMREPQRKPALGSVA